jgi:transcriptional regulator with XRE-family HTH domain
MHPFGETVLAWRLARGLTQAELARSAGVPRPNLSAIERGDREVTLRTLRALAFALDVGAGALVDGVMPDAGAPPLTRAQMERVARATARGIRLADPRESRLSQRLGVALSAQLDRSDDRARSGRRAGARQKDRAYFLLRTSEEPTTLASLVTRVVERLERP